MATKQQPAPVTLVATTGIWTGKQRIEAGSPLPDYLTEEQKQRLVKTGAVKEATKGD